MDTQDDRSTRISHKEITGDIVKSSFSGMKKCINEQEARKQI